MQRARCLTQFGPGKCHRLTQPPALPRATDYVITVVLFVVTVPSELPIGLLGQPPYSWWATVDRWAVEIRFVPLNARGICAHIYSAKDYGSQSP